jgi:hypothetical protein
VSLSLEELLSRTPRAFVNPGVLVILALAILAPR